jgi:hypothetical protein
MSPFLFLLLLLLPLFNAEHIQTEFENNDDLLMQRSLAARYLCEYSVSNSIVIFSSLILVGYPIRRYQRQLLDLPIDSLSVSSSLDSDDQLQQPRTKRIYWENLAFHAADYNQKGKKV